MGLTPLLEERIVVITRRHLLAGIAGAGAGGLGLAGYAVAESFGLKVASYALTPPRWPAGLTVRLAVITDLHACNPWMPVERIEEIVAITNGLKADAILMLGDFVSGGGIERFATPVPHRDWANALSALRAPFGVHAVLGNHDWWEDYTVQVRGRGPTPAGKALEAAGIRVHENNAVRFSKNGKGFWIAGLGDQWAVYLMRHRNARAVNGIVPRYAGADDLGATMAAITDNAPVVLMVHEPDIFPQVPDRVSLTLAGHTHGGQIRFFGYAPIVPSRYGRRYVYGHIVEEGRHLIVSAGLGCSKIPFRLGAEPEITLVDLGASPSA